MRKSWTQGDCVAMRNDQPMLDASLNRQFGEKLGSHEPSSVVRGSKANAAAVTVASTLTAISLFLLGHAVMRLGSGQRLLGAVICDMLALGAYAASFRLSRQGAERSIVAFGILGGVLLIAGTLFALSVAG